MGLFRPYERSDKASRTRTSTVRPKERAPERTETPEEPARTAPRKKVVRRGEKTGPTPTRREAEAARMARLHPTLSRKERRKADREAKYKAQQEAWDRMERGPERTLLRDFVDTRWTLTEFMMPAMILIMALMFVFLSNFEVSSIIALVLWALFLASIVNIWLMWRSFKRLLAERVPNANKRGLLMYMMTRAIMIRRFRRPAPRIARGDPI